MDLLCDNFLLLISCISVIWFKRFFFHVFVSAHSPPRSPDSVLKLKLCPPLPFFPASSSSQSYRSTFDKGSRGEYHDQRKKLLSNSSPPPHYTLFETHLGSQAPSPVALESISRGPDGRFLVQLLEQTSNSSKKKNLMEGFQQVNCGASGSESNHTSFRESPKSSIFTSEKDEKRTFPLNVDVPQLNIPPSPGRVRAMASNFSRHGCFYSDDELSSKALLERASFYSDISEKKPSDSFRRSCVPSCAEDMLPIIYRKTKLLDRNRPRPSDNRLLDSELTDNSTMISQLNSDLDKDSRDKCMHLTKERKQTKRELGNYPAEQSCGQNELQFNKGETPQREILKSKEDPVWKPQHVTMRQKHMPTGQTSSVSEYRRACYFGNTSSPTDRLSRSCIQWDVSPITSVTSSVPVQSHQETITSRSRYSQTCMETTEDSFTIETSHSPVTQNISLPVLTPVVNSEDPTPVMDVCTSPRASSGSRQADAEPLLREKALGDSVMPGSRHSFSGSQIWGSAGRSPEVDSERPGISATASYNQSDRTAAIECTATKDHSPTGFSTLPCHQHEVGARAKELERESLRTCSKRSNKFLFTDSPSPISTLTLVEEVDTELSLFSVPRMSGTFKAKPTDPCAKMSPQQTSAVLEYLSLPGFIEMSVDEPEEDADITGTSGKSSEQNSERSLRTKCDAVSKNWQVHAQESQEINSKQTTVFGQATFQPAAESSSHYSSKQIQKQSLEGKSRDSAVRVRFPDEVRPSSPSLEKTSKQLYDEKTQIRAARKNTDRSQFRFGSRSAHTLLSAAKGMAEVVSKHSQSDLDGRESLLEQSRYQCSQASRANNIALRICQAPLPSLRKSFSAGPCRALSGMTHPHPFLKKSFSLGSQRWEHVESPRLYISEKCYWDEIPRSDIRSYSLSRSQSSSPRPDPIWREYIPHRRPSIGSLESPGNAQRSLASSSYLTSSLYTPRQVSPFLEPADPRRQAAFIPESNSWSPSYQDRFRSAQQKYIAMPVSRGEHMISINPRRCPPRFYIPRGVSCPTNYYASAPPREGEVYPHLDRMIRREGEMDEGRTSYASQSSGRGSAVLFRQSLSVTPTLLSSPETTEESGRLRAEMEPLERTKR